MTYNVYNFRNHNWPIATITDSNRSYIQQINFIKSENPDIIGLQELSFTSDTTNKGAFPTAYVDRNEFESDLKEYKFIYKSVHKFPISRCNEKCLEIAIGIKNTYTFTKINIGSNGVGIKVEGIGIIVNNHIPYKYTSTKQELQSILDNIKREVDRDPNVNVIHMGDFNKDSKGFGNLMEAYTTDVTNDVTGLNQMKNIDRIYWKGALGKYSAVTIPHPKMWIQGREVNISDHYPVIQLLEVTPVQNASQSPIASAHLQHRRDTMRPQRVDVKHDTMRPQSVDVKHNTMRPPVIQSLEVTPVQNATQSPTASAHLQHRRDTMRPQRVDEKRGICGTFGGGYKLLYNNNKTKYFSLDKS
jgi:endonuclease/exonuclease/phosphatase family metal-dependent hydrolase